ncbi:hypothetical protein [Haemophilus parainfluenzae]|uniref:hypothetical protein n=1 Tax=Haemophilus parainfluenzae TaxID=729 RepID=UPI0015A31F0B|nr:hypothetical protein [Haemophilus parainfluenzae]QOR25728.1 hypothetical protein INP90_10080 [Haemophilus parainfluenzae]
MENDYIAEKLNTLKKEIENRPNKIQYSIDTHIKDLNECVNRRYSLQDIFNYLFNDEKQVTFKYFKNMLYRARKRLTKKTGGNNQPEKLIETQPKTAQVVKKDNLFSILDKQEEKKELHDNRSDKQAVDDRFARLLAEKEKQNK